MLRRTLPAILTLLLALLAVGCSTTNPQAEATPALGPRLPLSEARQAWIARILAQDPLYTQTSQPAPRQSNAQIVAKHRAERSLDLPDAYWARWKDNLDAFNADAAQHKEAQRQRYISTFIDQLNRADDLTLERLAEAPGDLDPASSRAWKNRLIERYSRYIIDSELDRPIIDAHLQRMALMDRHYGVCAIDPDCWDRAPQP